MARSLTEHFSLLLNSRGAGIKKLGAGIKKLGPGDFSTPAPSLAAGGEVLIQFESLDNDEPSASRD